MPTELGCARSRLSFRQLIMCVLQNDQVDKEMGCGSEQEVVIKNPV